MKKIALVFSLIIVLGACTKKMEKVLPGTWNYTQEMNINQTASTAGINVSQNVNLSSTSGSITFNEDGSGTISESGAESVSFTWSGEGKEKVTIIVDDTEVIYTVNTNKKKEQEWETVMVGQEASVFTDEIGSTYASQSIKVVLKLSK